MYGVTKVSEINRFLISIRNKNNTRKISPERILPLIKEHFKSRGILNLKSCPKAAVKLSSIRNDLEYYLSFKRSLNLKLKKVQLFCCKFDQSTLFTVNINACDHFWRGEVQHRDFKGQNDHEGCKN